MGNAPSGAEQKHEYDVVVIGGGPAGLNAALVLGRARRRTILIDAGHGRNAMAPEAHNVFTRDGTPPAELRRIGREQLGVYGVEVRQATVVAAAIVEDGFTVTLADGSAIKTRKLLLATGVADDLPPIAGLAERWGTSVFNCPFCHGWEVRDQRLAAHGNGTAGFETARVLRGWSDDVTLLTDGPAAITLDERATLTALGIPIREEPIDRLDGADGALERIVFADGSTLACHAMLMRPPRRQRSELAADLGCEHTETGLVRVDGLGRTSVPGVFAAGDATTEMAMVVLAAAAGAMAAAAITRDLLEEDHHAVAAAGRAIVARA